MLCSCGPNIQEGKECKLRYKDVNLDAVRIVLGRMIIIDELSFTFVELSFTFVEKIGCCMSSFKYAFSYCYHS